MSDDEVIPVRKLMPPKILLIALLLMAALHLLVPITQLIDGSWRALGAVPVLAGFIVNMWAARLFTLAGTAIRPTAASTSLVRTGPFRLSRNPMYLGMVLLLLGIAVGLGSASPWLIVPLFVALISRRFIALEERKMEREFGAEYLAYKAKVRRWI